MITIVTVTYNAEPVLERTLRSMEEQTFNDVEHIIMDGASTDRTLAMSQTYKDRNEGRRIIIVSERDNGLYDAMNKAIDMATGKYICFLNAGDKLHSPETLEHVATAATDKCRCGANADSDIMGCHSIGAAECTCVGIIYGDTDIVDDNGNRLRSRRLSPPDKLTWKSFRHGMLVCHQAFYVNTSIVEKYNTKYRFSADFDWCVRAMKNAEKQGLCLVNTKKILADYLSEGMTTANHKASLKERFRIMAVHYGLLSTIFQHLWFVVRAVIKR
ncbi:MAG: glycosyltransferase [Bacteroides sp.]|nr:glycosyltransferase [Bacteroides sp.]